ncbi:capsular polysaccharide synthesis protein [Nostoc sp. UHCC 0251]|uniref:capsular polysaccharide synthesis protein n=1 Tax=Nostoc sp. UHCC 0251 TaxID=3110240 RepID=UPI002B21F1D3|nr:capsular polysaccharide synthesis protein [Nostoc sp. UHCC 0251]MEA5624984.1 capsular polysaccharide synthesis protein [Nostoc sp. UHCC 0251]
MLNKKIWLLWFQGWKNAPWLVKQIAESWVINNPDWNIEYLTLDNLHNYVHDIDYIYETTKEIGPQAKSDIIRLSLLKNHGGVWADATMLCMQPLDTWVQEAVKPAGLWMYHGHGGGMNCKDGPASWLIVAEENSLIIDKWKSACDEYWKYRTHADSYYWLDGLFRKLYESDVKFRDKWKLAPHLYCESKGQAHSLAPFHYRMESNNKDIKKIFLEKPPYALKFWWKDWQDKFPDVNNTECKKSNGYYAIEMSKRKFIFKHVMISKYSVFFRIKMFILNVWFAFIMFKLDRLMLLKRIIRKVKISFL